MLKSFNPISQTKVVVRQKHRQPVSHQSALSGVGLEFVDVSNYHEDIISFSGGNNTLTGGEDIDEFWIATAEIPDTANTITDFEIGIDVLGIAGLGIGFDSLSITQDGDNTLVSLESQNLAILLDTNASSLNADNFVFA